MKENRHNSGLCKAYWYYSWRCFMQDFLWKYENSISEKKSKMVINLDLTLK